MPDSIPQIPGGPGGSLVNLIPQNNDAAVAGGYIVEIGQVLTMFGGIAAIVGVVLIAAGVLIEIFADVIQAFVPGLAGRPKEEATWEAAKRLMSAKNGAARLYGVMLMRILKDDGIVISDSNPAHQKILGTANHQFVVNLEAQGVSLTRARQIAVNALSRGSQAGAPLEKELQQPTPSNLYFTGPQSILAAYQIGYLHGQELGYTDPKLSLYAQKYAVLHAPLRDMLKAQWSTTPPTPPQGPGPQGGTTPQPGNSNWLTLPQPIPNPNCQDSYKLDPNTGQYTPTPYCGLVPAGFSYDPATDTATPGLPPDDESIAASQDLSYALAAIAYQLKLLNPPGLPATGSQGGENGQADCCAQLVAAINAIAEALPRSSVAIPPDGESVGATPSLSGVLSALEVIAKSVEQLPSLAEKLIECACKEGEGTPDDLRDLIKQIADAQTKWLDLNQAAVQKVHSVTEYLVKLEVVDPQLGQLVLSN